MLRNGICARKRLRGKGKYGRGKEKTVFHFRKLFNQGSEEILELSERKRGGVDEVSNEGKTANLD